LFSDEKIQLQKMSRRQTTVRYSNAVDSVACRKFLVHVLVLTVAFIDRDLNIYVHQFLVAYIGMEKYLKPFCDF
jgi:hypothetical protein